MRTISFLSTRACGLWTLDKRIWRRTATRTRTRKGAEVVEGKKERRRREQQFKIACCSCGNGLLLDRFFPGGPSLLLLLLQSTDLQLCLLLLLLFCRVLVHSLTLASFALLLFWFLVSGFLCFLFFRFGIHASGTYAYLLRFIKHSRKMERMYAARRIIVSSSPGV